jgi:PAS domain S-box-containing protein
MASSPASPFGPLADATSAPPAAAVIEPLEAAFDRLIACALRVLEVDVAAIWHERATRIVARGAGAPPVALIGRIGARTAAEGAPFLVTDLVRPSTDPTSDPTRDALRDAGLRAVAAVPFGSSVGALCVFAVAPRRWSEDECAVLHGLAAGALSEVLLREAMARAEERRDRMLRMLERVTDGFVAIDRDWRFAYVNPSAERLMERTLNEVVGKVAWDVFPEAMATLFGPAVRRAAETGEMQVVEDQVPFSGRWLEARIFPSEDGLSIYLHDTTDRRLAERERQARATTEARLEGVVLAGREAAHLLNNDIALPMGLSELALLDPTLSDRSRALLVQIRRGLERLHTTIRRFQSIARVATKDTPAGTSLDLARSSEDVVYARASASISSK